MSQILNKKVDQKRKKNEGETSKKSVKKIGASLLGDSKPKKNKLVEPEVKRRPSKVSRQSKTSVTKREKTLTDASFSGLIKNTDKAKYKKGKKAVNESKETIPKANKVKPGTSKMTLDDIIAEK